MLSPKWGGEMPNQEKSKNGEAKCRTTEKSKNGEAKCRTKKSPETGRQNAKLKNPKKKESQKWGGEMPNQRKNFKNPILLHKSKIQSNMGRRNAKPKEEGASKKKSGAKIGQNHHAKAYLPPKILFHNKTF